MTAGNLIETKLPMKSSKIRVNFHLEWQHLENTYIPRDYSMGFIVMLDSKHAKEDQAVSGMKSKMPIPMLNGSIYSST